MQSSPRIEPDDLDQWISQVLAEITENVQPPEQVWHRILCHVANLARTEQTIAHRAAEERSGVAIGQAYKLSAR